MRGRAEGTCTRTLAVRNAAEADGECAEGSCSPAEPMRRIAAVYGTLTEAIDHCTDAAYWTRVPVRERTTDNGIIRIFAPLRVYLSIVPGTGIYLIHLALAGGK